MERLDGGSDTPRRCCRRVLLCLRHERKRRHLVVSLSRVTPLGASGVLRSLGFRAAAPGAPTCTWFFSLLGRDPGLNADKYEFMWLKRSNGNVKSQAGEKEVLPPSTASAAEKFNKDHATQTRRHLSSEIDVTEQYPAENERTQRGSHALKNQTTCTGSCSAEPAARVSGLLVPTVVHPTPQSSAQAGGLIHCTRPSAVSPCTRPPTGLGHRSIPLPRHTHDSNSKAQNVQSLQPQTSFRYFESTPFTLQPSPAPGCHVLPHAFLEKRKSTPPPPPNTPNTSSMFLPQSTVSASGLHHSCFPAAPPSLSLHVTSHTPPAHPMA